jgi:hypothetical protein
MNLARALSGPDWLGPKVANSNLPPATCSHPFVKRRRHARAGSAPWRARSRPVSVGESIAGGLSALSRRTSLRRRSGVSSSGGRTSISRWCATWRRCHRTPLMRFLPLQRVPTAMRCPREPPIGRSRFGVVRPVASRAFADLRDDDLSCDLVLRPVEVGASPLRFYALRM